MLAMIVDAMMMAAVCCKVFIVFPFDLLCLMLLCLLLYYSAEKREICYTDLE